MNLDYPGGIALISGSILESNDASAKMKLGTLRQDDEGNIYKYVRANEALARGDCVTPIAKGAWDSTVVMNGASAVGDTELNIDTNTSAFTKNEFAGYFVSQATATGLGKAYQIKSHPAIDASSECAVVLENPCEEIIADGGVLLIFNPNLVELIDADTEVITGVAIGTITADYYGWIQVAGHVMAVKAGHSTSNAIVLNEALVPVSGNPGAVQGRAGILEADLMEVGATPLISLQAVNADTTGFVEAIMYRKF